MLFFEPQLCCCLTKYAGLYFVVCTFLPPYLGDLARRRRGGTAPAKFHSYTPQVTFGLWDSGGGCRKSAKSGHSGGGIGSRLHDGRQPTQKGRNKAPSLAYCCKYPSYSTSTCYEDMWDKKSNWSKSRYEGTTYLSLLWAWSCLNSNMSKICPG